MHNPLGPMNDGVKEIGRIVGRPSRRRKGYGMSLRRFLFT